MVIYNNFYLTKIFCMLNICSHSCHGSINQILATINHKLNRVLPVVSVMMDWLSIFYTKETFSIFKVIILKKHFQSSKLKTEYLHWYLFESIVYFVWSILKSGKKTYRQPKWSHQIWRHFFPHITSQRIHGAGKGGNILLNLCRKRFSIFLAFRQWNLDINIHCTTCTKGNRRYQLW